MLRRSCSLFLYPLIICLCTGVFFLVRLSFSNIDSVAGGPFGAAMKFQACPPSSNSPNCYTSTPKPPTPKPPTPIPPTADPVVPIVPNTPVPDTDTGPRPNRHATLTALAYYYMSPTPTGAVSSTQEGVIPQPIDPALPTVTTEINATLPVPVTATHGSGNTFIVITIVFVGGIFLAAFLLRR